MEENQVGASRCVLSGYSTFMQSPPAIKQKLYLNDSFFPPKVTVTGCYLLDLQSACCLAASLTDWRLFYFFLFVLPPVCLHVCLFCLLTWLPVDLLVYLSVSLLEYTESLTFFKGTIHPEMKHFCLCLRATVPVENLSSKELWNLSNQPKQLWVCCR